MRWESENNHVNRASKSSNSKETVTVQALTARLKHDHHFKRPYRLKHAYLKCICTG